MIYSVFYADVPGQPSRFDEYREYIIAGKKALEETNPDYTYMLLTDVDTWRNHEIGSDLCAVYPCAPSNKPLMLQYIFAQIGFLNSLTYNLKAPAILAATDCIPNNSLKNAIPTSIGFAITHRGKKFNYKINNVGYVYDVPLAIRFLERAAEILETWSFEKRMWYGDQEAWEAVLGDWEKPANGENFLGVSTPIGFVNLLPCSGWNRITKKKEKFKGYDYPHILHFKGPRKNNLVEYVDKVLLK